MFRSLLYNLRLTCLELYYTIWHWHVCFPVHDRFNSRVVSSEKQQSHNQQRYHQEDYHWHCYQDLLSVQSCHSWNIEAIIRGKIAWIIINDVASPQGYLITSFKRSVDILCSKLRCPSTGCKIYLMKVSHRVWRSYEIVLLWRHSRCFSFITRMII